jgi:RNA polymerase sigma-70 factor (ECF subfamily)
VGGDPVDSSDSELLEATRAGDEGGFLELYRRHGDRVYRFAYRMTGSSDLARDVTQSCFVSLLEAPSRYDARRAGLGTYLCAAARNLCLRHAGRAWRERPLPDGGDRASREPSPEEALISEERSRAVRDAVLALAPLHREVLILAEYEDLGVAEIARIVGAEAGAVRVRLYRARRKLRAALEAGTASPALLTEARTR